MQFRLSFAGVMPALLLALAGCLPEDGEIAQGAGPQHPPPGEATPCAPGARAGLVGEPVEAAERVPAPKRILRPGDMRTMDYLPARTNIEIDETGRITRVFCG
ncbi:I78 family peptidase inhibitor [Marinovum algicola]|uniref:I78 family peptidase inhibitor n=1 Tax=Marinovum algicola TaxID=42444 RepID=UPI0032ED774E